MHYDQFTYPKQVSVTYRDVTSKALEWMELITCDTATPLVSYNHKVWGDYAAVTENDYGKGHTMYLGTQFGEDTLRELLLHFFSKAGLNFSNKFIASWDSCIRIKQGKNDFGKDIVYLLNYSDQIQNVQNGANEAKDLLSDKTVSALDTLAIGPWDLAILEY